MALLPKSTYITSTWHYGQSCFGTNGSAGESGRLYVQTTRMNERRFNVYGILESKLYRFHVLQDHLAVSDVSTAMSTEHYIQVRFFPVCKDRETSKC